MATSDEDSVFGKPRPKTETHVIGQGLDDLSAPELAERIASSLEAQGRQIDWMVNTAAPLLAAASELMADPSAAMRLFTGRK